jgi:hypothetical protein
MGKSGVLVLDSHLPPPCPALLFYLGACPCPMTEAPYQLHWVPKAQESEAQKERHGGQQGVVLVDLQRQTDRQTLEQTYFLPPSQPSRRPVLLLTPHWALRVWTMGNFRFCAPHPQPGPGLIP